MCSPVDKYQIILQNAGKFWKLSQAVQSDVGYYLIRLAKKLKASPYECPPSWIQTLRDNDTKYETFLKEVIQS
jgi:hypothetical protein